MRSLTVCAGLVSIASLAACASILGDFEVGEQAADSGTDAAKIEDGHVTDVAADTTGTTDSGKDASDATIADDATTRRPMRAIPERATRRRTTPATETRAHRRRSPISTSTPRMETTRSSAVARHAR